MQTPRERPLFRQTQIWVTMIGSTAHCLRCNGWGADWESKIVTCDGLESGSENLSSSEVSLFG
jgi:hypothetical protein